jgi:hypothetical protein
MWWMCDNADGAGALQAGNAPRLALDREVSLPPVSIGGHVLRNISAGVAPNKRSSFLRRRERA